MGRPYPANDARHDLESKFMDRVAPLMRQKGVGPESGFIPSASGRTAAAQNDSPAAPYRSGATPPAAAQNPAAMDGHERNPASRRVVLESVAATAATPDRGVAMNNEGEKISGREVLIDKNSPLMMTQASKHAERDAMPFRAESLSPLSQGEIKSPSSDLPPGTRTQSIINQIMDARQSMNSDFGRVRIVLSPPHLGTVDLDITVRNERVAVVMTTENSGVQQALQYRADDIRIALQRHDLKIDGFQVLLADTGTNEQHRSHGGALFEQRREHQSRQNDDNDNVMPGTVPAASFMPFLRESGSARDRLSIFA